MPTATKILFVNLVLASTLLSACFHCVHGSGNVIEEKRALSEFQSIDLEVPGTLYVSQQAQGPVTIRTDDNIMRILSTEVRGDTLVIKRTEEKCCLDPTELTITASAETVENLRISGSGDIVVRGELKGQSIAFEIDGSGSIRTERSIVAQRGSIDIDGSGDIDVGFQLAELRTSIDGSGDIILTGTSKIHDIDIDGSGEVEALGLSTDNTRVQIDGSGDCRVTVQEYLEVNIDGSGDVRYRGTPRITQSIDGSGSIGSI